MDPCASFFVVLALAGFAAATLSAGRQAAGLGRRAADLEARVELLFLELDGRRRAAESRIPFAQPVEEPHARQA